MNASLRLPQRAAALTGTAVVTVALLSGCGSGTKPDTNQTPGSSAPAPSSVQSTEKNLSLTGGNSFSPPVQATPAQTAPPGKHKY